MKRYYNLKEGNRKVNGQIIEVNLDAILEKRVKNLIYGTQANLLEYKRYEGLYEFHLNEAHSLRANPFPVLEAKYSSQPKSMVTLAVSDKGDLKLHKKPSNIRLYLEEITEAEAKSKREDAKNWMLLQAWV